MSVDNEARDLGARAEAQDLPAPRAAYRKQRPQGAVSAAEEFGTAVLVALADPTRWRLLEVLVEVGHASATTLADRLPVSRQAVVKHLQVLKSAGLVGGSRMGREVVFVARPAALRASAQWLAELSDAWRIRLEQTSGEPTDGSRSREPL